MQMQLGLHCAVHKPTCAHLGDTLQCQGHAERLRLHWLTSDGAVGGADGSSHRCLTGSHRIANISHGQRRQVVDAIPAEDDCVLQPLCSQETEWLHEAGRGQSTRKR